MDAGGDNGARFLKVRAAGLNSGGGMGPPFSIKQEFVGVVQMTMALRRSFTFSGSGGAN